MDMISDWWVNRFVETPAWMVNMFMIFTVLALQVIGNKLYAIHRTLGGIHEKLTILAEPYIRDDD
jgi:hypothetical protein